jgi:hypothetical protein
MAMDDYRDLVTAGFAVLCAALMLVAGLLFILSTDDSKPASEIEPSKRAAPVISERLQVPPYSNSVNTYD